MFVLWTFTHTELIKHDYEIHDMDNTFTDMEIWKKILKFVYTQNTKQMTSLFHQNHILNKCSFDMKFLPHLLCMCLWCNWILVSMRVRIGDFRGWLKAWLPLPSYFRRLWIVACLFSNSGMRIYVISKNILTRPEVPKRLYVALPPLKTFQQFHAPLPEYVQTEVI
jgi:hypothetical protein